MRFSFFATLTCLAVGQAATFNKINDDWSFDVNEGNNAYWMSNIDDSKSLSSLAIPGTHNSVTNSLTGSLTSKLVQTQNVPLEQQLIGGIRYIDITCKVTKKGFMVYHGLSETASSFGNVLTTIFDFLDLHRSETVILRIQMGGVHKSSKSFIDSLQYYLTPGSELGNRAVNRVYSKGDDHITTIPTLGELRGKVFILEDFKTTSPGRYGLPWTTDTVSSYSRKFSASTLFMDSKWDDIKSHLREAPSDSSTKLRITHTTASFGVSPINFAARNAPKVGMNKHLGDYLSDERGACFGIVVIDFPGQKLVKQILLLNEDFRNAESPDVMDQSEVFTAANFLTGA
ncbi:1-phosphatidylinositol phosphodiesterase [Ceratocystis lukuohia]|uniref:1-phosphatidylinositol phosphodiesterase n=1 Tax=Ceratocystis lukuohia TaxID=2019550 RepID=A0ABR4MAD8_9PEZI